MSSIQPSSFEFSEQFASLEISGIHLTEKILGKGSDATVKEVNWVGTSCAAKQLHEILLEDDSPGGAKRFVDNFEKECMTWSKLIHPHIVQFLGVYFLSPGSRVPSLILEKMDTSLRHYLENHIKENFVLPDKIYVLRQVAQALSYLHSRSPPLVHRDLSPNNILLNEVSLQAKVTDFGMTRAIDPSKMTRKSSAKGTLAFMPPESLHSPPRYDEKLDVFSYGNVIVTTVIHDWPEPGPPTGLAEERGKVIDFNELERRQQYLDLFTPKENELFLPIVGPCLQNDPTMRPTSIQLVNQMRGIEESHPRRVQDSTVIPQLHQELQLKDEQLREKDQQLCDIHVEQMRKNLEESSQQWEEIKELQTEGGQHLKEIDHHQEVEQLRHRLHVLLEEVHRFQSKSSSVTQPVSNPEDLYAPVLKNQKLSGSTQPSETNPEEVLAPVIENGQTPKPSLQTEQLYAPVMKPKKPSSKPPPPLTKPKPKVASKPGVSPPAVNKALPNDFVSLSSSRESPTQHSQSESTSPSPKSKKKGIFRGFRTKDESKVTPPSSPSLLAQAVKKAATLPKDFVVLPSSRDPLTQLSVSDVDSYVYDHDHGVDEVPEIPERSDDFGLCDDNSLPPVPPRQHLSDFESDNEDEAVDDDEGEIIKTIYDCLARAGGPSRETEKLYDTLDQYRKVHLREKNEPKGDYSEVSHGTTRDIPVDEDQYAIVQEAMKEFKKHSSPLRDSPVRDSPMRELSAKERKQNLKVMKLAAKQMERQKKIDEKKRRHEEEQQRKKDEMKRRAEIKKNRQSKK